MPTEEIDHISTGLVSMLMERVAVLEDLLNAHLALLGSARNFDDVRAAVGAFYVNRAIGVQGKAVQDEPAEEEEPDEDDLGPPDWIARPQPLGKDVPRPGEER
jgi:hypothetical protein